MTGTGGLVLLARSRSWPRIAYGLVLLAGVAAVAAGWLASRPYFPGSQARVPVVALAPVAAAALIGLCLGSWDVGLDRSTPHPWRTTRTAQVLGWTTAAAAILWWAAAHDPQIFGALALTRNLIGYIGLECITATLIGAPLAWLPGFVYASTTYLTAPREITGLDRLWAWPMTPGSVDLAWVVPVALLVLGCAIYARRGPREAPRGD